MLAVILAVTVFAQVVTPPQNVTVRNEVTVQIPPPDPQAISDASVTSSQAVMNTYIAPAPVAWANDLLGLPNIWTQTDPNLTYDNAGIKSLAEKIRNVAAALMALFIFGKGIAIMVGRDDISSLGRPLLAAILSIGNLTFWKWGIDLNNAINAAISAPELPSLIRPHLTTTIDPAAGAQTVILLVVYAITAILLMFSQLFRLGVIDVLIAAGSLLLLCKAMPETDYIATHYTRISGAFLFGQVILCICLSAASVLSTLGGAGVLGTLVSCAILWLARSAPQQIMAGATSSAGSRLGGLAARMVLRRLGR